MSFAAPPFSRCVTAATEVVMIGGGGRRTGVGARRLSIERDRNTLRGLAVVGDVTRDADICMLGTRLSDVTATCVVAAAAKLSTRTDVDDGVDGDVTGSSCPLSEVISFCAVVETCGTFDTWLLNVAGCDMPCVVVIKTVESGDWVVDEANDVTGFCEVVDMGFCAEVSVVAVIEFRAVVETGGMDAAAFECDIVAACDVTVCAEVVIPVSRVLGLCGCVAVETIDVTGFCALVDADTSAGDSVVAVVEFRPAVEISGIDMAAFDIRLLFVTACDVIICAEVVIPVGKAVGNCGFVAGETTDVTGFCAVAERSIEFAAGFDACPLDGEV